MNFDEMQRFRFSYIALCKGTTPHYYRNQADKEGNRFHRATNDRRDTEESIVELKNMV